MTARVKGLNRLQARIMSKLTPAVIAASRPAVKAAGAIVKDAVKERISYTDHTLGDLARMDNPYATRHASIMIHPGEVRVHKQSGTMLKALRGRVSPKRVRSMSLYRVFFDQTKAQHVLHVLYGTKLMHARDVMGDVTKDRRVRLEVMRAMTKVFGKEFKTQAGLRFTK